MARGRLLTVPQVAAKLLVTVDTVHRWVRTGLLPAARVEPDGRYVVREEDVTAVMNRARRHPEQDDITDPETARSPGAGNIPPDVDAGRGR